MSGNWTQQHLDDLDEAIASGASSIEFADRKVTYRGIEKMFQIRDRIAASLGQANSGPSTAVAKHESGF